MPDEVDRQVRKLNKEHRCKKKERKKDPDMKAPWICRSFGDGKANRWEIPNMVLLNRVSAYPT